MLRNVSETSLQDCSNVKMFALVTRNVSGMYLKCSENVFETFQNENIMN